MSTPRFDRAKPFGQIHPPFHGAGLHQDGCYFSAQGDFLFRDGETPGTAASKVAGAQDAPATTEAKTKQAKKSTQRPADKQKAATAPDGQPDSESAPADESEALDLAAWARGDVKPPFFAVKAAAAEALGVPSVKGTAAEIRAMLKEKGVI